MKNYKKLTVWNHAMDLVQDVYLWSKQLPSDERYGLTSQIRRASVSVPANIAEGNATTTDKALNRYLGIALGSAFELETHLLIVSKVYPEIANTGKIVEKIDRLQMMILAFMRKLGT
ncbi:MAG: four helix bundle protein [Flavobacteriales bacterium]|nr:four helix bundle protein [Flavobacteriales bacterium]